MDNSDKFNLGKEKEIEKLKVHNEFIVKLLEGNSRVKILTTEYEEQISLIFDNNEKYLHKLESNEFEIAIVGLEKAGKSTFANALIENSVLPSAPERCTFTSTRLVSGNDKATIEFYSEKEFNFIFQELLNEIEYPSPEHQDYKTLHIDKFNRHFEQLEEKNPSLYKNHIGKTDEEIKDILSCREKLILTGKIKEFSGNELLEESFQSYIKGENKGRDTSKPRSVKSIEIESSKLKKLESAVIYDVPGFDSPTKIHLRQTEERLKKADAIILVTNVGRNPSIQGTALSVINKNTDEDGIPLRDKLFVFGNQIDTANSKDESEGNEAILIKDVEKYKIGEAKRVFTGSALKYLVDKKIIKKEYKDSFNVDSGVESIRNELIHYYENERFEILKRKIDTNKKRLQDIFESILENSDMDFDQNFSENEKARIIREAYKGIEKRLEEGLNKLKFNLKEEIWSEKYFSNKFEEDVDDFNYFREIDIEFVKEVKISEDDSLTIDIPIEKINQQIRKKIHKKYLEEFSGLINQMTDEKAKEIEVRILRDFTTAIVGDDNDTYIYDEVQRSSKNFINKLTSNISHNEGRFIYLIERFSRDIFDILLSYPILSEDRSDKFRKAYKEFMYLNNFYGDGHDALINMILTGSDNKLIDGVDTILSLAKKIISLDVTYGASGLKAIILEVKDIVGSMEKFSSNGSLKSRFDLKKITAGATRSKTENDVLLEINKDIANLKKSLKIAIIPAINLELAFLNGVDKQIKVLIESSKEDETEAAKIYGDFISKIVPKIKKSEIDGINIKIENSKMQKEFLKEMSAFEF